MLCLSSSHNNLVSPLMCASMEATIVIPGSLMPKAAGVRIPDVAACLFDCEWLIPKCDVLISSKRTIV